MGEICASGSGAARLAAIPAGESPASTRSPVHAVVISSGSEGDRTAGSLEVKALWGWGDLVRSVAGGRATWQAAAEANREAPKYVPRVKRIAGGLGVPSCSDLGEGYIGVGELDLDDHRTPRGHRERHARKEWSAKARNHSRVA
jgi:hypothetical protein